MHACMCEGGQDIPKLAHGWKGRRPCKPLQYALAADGDENGHHSLSCAEE